jgi:large subunit ribosomal protein L18
MTKLATKEYKRILRHERIRKQVSGTTDRPRLCVHRSLKNISAQIIDDTSGKVLFGMSTMGKDLKKNIKYGGNKDAAAKFGEKFAEAAQKKGLKKVCFDRGGYLYHGRVKAFAEAVRQAGMEF